MQSTASVKPVKGSNKQHLAKLRVCARCEWVFKMTHTAECPQCGFGSYGAHYVYGQQAYTYAINQKPWLDNQMVKAKGRLYAIIKEGACCYKHTAHRGWQGHDERCPNHAMVY